MKLMNKIGSGCFMCLKAVMWLLLGVLHLAIEMVKVILLLFGMILQLFVCFVRAGTP